jgi:ribosomal protein S18 acetylase RimI-like enzyme
MSAFILSEGFQEAERGAIVALLREYETGIGVSLCFQDFEAEVAGLPGDYAPPGGTLILARRAQEPGLVGCVALRRVSGACDLCEMKRLYVRAEARKTGLGRQLALAAIAAGRRLGYHRICLDTLPGMTAAQALYQALGFRRTGLGADEPRVILFERTL